MIIALVGRADNHELVFTRGDDGLWRVAVPADLSDGQYVVELTATTDAGKQGYWTGILYLNHAWEVCAHIIEDDLSVWLSSDYIGTELAEDVTASLAADDLIFEIDEDDVYVTLGRCCCA